MRRRVEWISALIVLALGAEAAAFTPSLYLTSEGTAVPGFEPPTIKLEAQGLPYADVRIYKIPDPEAYVRGLADPHRPVTDNTPRRPSSIDLLVESYQRTFRQEYRGLRVALARPSRKAIKKVVPDVKRELEEVVRANPKGEQHLAVLRDFPLLAAWREDLTDGGEWVYRELPFGEREPGVYLVEATQGHEAAHTVVIVGSLAMVTRQGPGQLVVYTTDAATGEPIADADVSIYDGKKLIARERTDGNGLLRKAIGGSHLLVFARAAAGFAVHDPVYHPAQVRERRGYVYTERPVYRPGQTVHWKTILRDPEGENRWKLPPAGERAEITVADPGGSAIIHAQGKVTSAGTLDGEFEIPTETAMGVYSIAVAIDERRFGGELKVKDYVKPESAVTVSTSKPAYAPGETVEVHAQARYFFGAPVVDAEYQWEVARTRFYVPRWQDADGSYFYSAAEAQSTRREVIDQGKGKVDDKGDVRFSFKTRPDSLDYSYVVEVRVVDSGKRVTTGEKALTVTHGAFHVDVRTERLLAQPKQPTDVKIRARDYGDKAVQTRVQVAILAEHPGADGKPVSEKILEHAVDLDAKGEGTLRFTPPRSGYYRVVATARDAQSHAIEGEGFVFSTEAGGDLPFAPDKMALIADKASYRPGERAQLLLLTPFAETKALVTVEGHDILSAEVQAVSHYSRVLDVKISDDLLPNAFVSVVAVSGGEMYRVEKSLVVPPRDRLLHVALSSEKPVYRPAEGASVEVLVTDGDGKPVADADVALAVVDEAIYEISPEIATPIELFFYPRRRPNVMVGSSLTYKFYGYSRKQKGPKHADNWERPRWSWGAVKQLDDERLRKDDRDTAAWQPSLRTNRDGKARLAFTLPTNLTKWRTTAWAATNDGRFGAGRGSFVSRKDLLVRIAAPRLLRAGDQAEASLSVHNYTGQAREVSLGLVGGTTATHQVKDGGRAAGTVPITAEQVAAAGGKLAVYAKSGGYEDGVQIQVPVEPAGFEDSDYATVSLGGAGNEAQSLASVELPADAIAGTASLRVTASSGVVPAILAGLRYNVGYPWGCTEQTLDRFMPSVVAAKALRELGIKNDQLEASVPKYVAFGLAHLKHLQHEDGGWGWWSDDATNPRMTAWVVQGLVLAQTAGADVDPEMLAAGTRRLGEFVRNRDVDDMSRAFCLYGLALAGVSNTQLATEMANHDPAPYVRAVVALALARMGAREVASTTLRPLLEAGGQARADVLQAGVRAVSPYREQEDPVELGATVTRALLEVQPDSSRIDDLVGEMLAQRRGDHWRSTRDTTSAVLALVDYAVRRKHSGGATTLDVSLDGKKLGEKLIAEADVAQPDAVIYEGPAALHAGANQIALHRGPSSTASPGPGPGPAPTTYATVTLRYRRTRGDTARVSRLAIERRYREQDGTTVGAVVHTGDIVWVELHVSPVDGEAEQVMVEDAIPAGLEPIERDYGYEGPFSLHPENVHREFRAGRALFFFTNLREPQKVGYMARAVFAGNYHAPPARASLMYYPEVGGRSRAQEIRVASESMPTSP